MGVVIDGCDGSDVETAGPLSRVGNTKVTSQIIATQDSIYTTSSDVDLGCDSQIPVLPVIPAQLMVTTETV